MDPEKRRRSEQECRDLITRLVHYYDHGNGEEAANLFVPDGIWVKSQVRCVGRAAIIASFASQAQSLVLRHFTSNILVTVHDELNASAVTYYLAFAGHRTGHDELSELPLDLPGSLGEWDDTFVATTDGWRFARREGRRVFRRKSPSL